MSQIFWTPGVKIDEMEKVIIEEAYKFYNGNKTTTANSLGISIRTLENKLEKYAQETKCHEERVKTDEERRREWLEVQRGNKPVPEWATQPQAGAGAHGRNGLESVKRISKEQAVSLPELDEVQEVLPPKAAVGGTPSGRRRL